MSMSDPDYEALIADERTVIVIEEARAVAGWTRSVPLEARRVLLLCAETLASERAARVAAEEQRDRAIADLIEAGNVAARLVAAEERADLFYGRWLNAVNKVGCPWACEHFAAPVVPVEPLELFPNDYPETL
jgi:hypothetical protein